MDTGVSWMLELSVELGRERDLKALMDEMVASTRANEPGTLDYEWSMSGDGRACHIFERYVDSSAVMTHLAAFDEKFGARFLGLLKPVRFVVYGSPSQMVRDALADLNPIYMEPVGGFSRE